MAVNPHPSFVRRLTLPFCSSAILLLSPACCQEQTASVQVIHSFTGTNGAGPGARLLQAPDGSLYGTTTKGGSSDHGTVFKVTPKGEFTLLVSFNGDNGDRPFAGLTKGNDGNFYGTTPFGGTNNRGTVFKLSQNGSFTNLLSFNRQNGERPFGGLTMGSDGSFYGTTAGGGRWDAGTIFRLTTNGVLTTLMQFDPQVNGTAPYAGLTPGADGNFYGTTFTGGSRGNGTVFEVTSNGQLTSLAFFGPVDGAAPVADLIWGSDGSLYGTTISGGRYISGPGNGTLFKVTTTGVLTPLIWFTYAQGAGPFGGLALGHDGNFYGTTEGGGLGAGRIFKMTPNGALTILLSFNGQNGAAPRAALTLGRDGNFYGTSSRGGLGYGTVFRLCLAHPPPVASAKIAPLFALPSNPTKLVVLASNVSDAAVALDASDSLEEIRPLEFNWYADSQTDPFALGPLVTNRFALGFHTVTLRLDDGCETGTIDLAFEVITVRKALTLLMQAVNDADLQSHNSQPLLGSLSAAAAAFDRGQVIPALHHLSAFENKLRAQWAPRDATVAEQLMLAAQQIVSASPDH